MLFMLHHEEECDSTNYAHVTMISTINLLNFWYNNNHNSTTKENVHINISAGILARCVAIRFANSNKTENFSISQPHPAAASRERRWSSRRVWAAQLHIYTSARGCQAAGLLTGERAPQSTPWRMEREGGNAIIASSNGIPRTAEPETARVSHVFLLLLLFSPSSSLSSFCHGIFFCRPTLSDTTGFSFIF